MKKIIVLVLLIVTLLLVTGCVNVQTSKVTIIAPSGTPSLGLASYFDDNDLIDYEIVNGSDALVASFTSKSKDIIIAPVNLGAKIYNTNKSYVLYKTFVWGNLFIASKNTINSINDLDGKELVVFSQNSTPDIVIKSILSYYDELNVSITYVSDVATANGLLASGQAEYIMSAEPSLSKVKDKLGLSVLDLQDEWKKITGSSSYPQAGIFVNKEIKDKKVIKDELNKMVESINNAVSNPLNCANSAIKIDSTFASLGVDVLVKAIPNCHYEILESDKDAVEYYLNKMIELGFGKQMGESIPDEDFYY